MTAYFVPDLYELDFSGPPPFEALVSNPQVAGVILKSTQGVQYAPNWFLSQWPRVKALAGSRYGTSFVRGTYHFGMATARGDVQADFCMRHIDKAGGLSSNDMPIAWDLEGSNNWSSPQQIVDISSQFSQRIKSLTGKMPILYTGALVRDWAIKDRMGFGKIWTPHLDMTKAGWGLLDYCLWQYAGGKGFYNPALASTYQFPTNLPGWGAGHDMSVVMSGGQMAASAWSVQMSLNAGILSSSLLLAGAAALAAYLIWK